MRYLMADLYRAFNPAVEIRSSTAWLFDHGRRHGELNQEELISQGSLTRHKLESSMPDLQFRILKLFFSEPHDMESTLVDVRLISSAVVAMSCIHCKINHQFVELCCLSEFWGTNLFATDKFGPLTRYESSVSYEMLRRRRCRIRDTLENLRMNSVSTAESLLYGDFEALVLVS